MTNKTKWVIAVSVAVVLFVIAVKPGKEDIEPVITPTPISRSIIKTGSVAKDTYMQACVDEAPEFDAYNYCECTYTHMIDSMGVEDFMDMAIEYEETDGFPKEMTEAIKACLYELE